MKEAYSKSIDLGNFGGLTSNLRRGIAYASVAFGVVCLIACLCCKDVDAKMTNKIEIYLENTENAKKNKYH